MIRKFFKGVTIAVAMVAGVAVNAAPALADWIAVAANADGYGYGVGSTEANAKIVAVEDCRGATGRACPVSTAVDSTWYLVLIRCDNGDYMTAGSRVSADAAANFAASKLSRTMRGCWLEGSW